jgi:hypothetical protein
MGLICWLLVVLVVRNAEAEESVTELVAVIGLVGVVSVLASFRGVRVDDDGVVLNYVWKRVRIGWDEVVAFDRRVIPNWFW